MEQEKRTGPPRISLTAARVNAGLTQKEAAQAIGIAQSTLKRYEAGKGKPRVDVMERISETYHYPAEYIRA